MDRKTAIRVLSDWAQAGRVVFTLGDFAKLFPGDSPKTRQEALNRLVRDGVLHRACRGVYVYALAGGEDPHMIERIAATLRRGQYNYISLESALSEYGAISQIPVDRLTVMTTGRKGSYRTPWGLIEFTHSRRKLAEILDGIRDVGRPLRLATPEAIRDLPGVAEKRLWHDGAHC